MNQFIKYTQKGLRMNEFIHYNSNMSAMHLYRYKQCKLNPNLAIVWLVP